MLKRKSHNKSRNGCQNCKKKHVKCDEQGPPCANCIARETTKSCKFGSKPHLLSQQSPDGTTSGSEIHAPSPSSSNTQNESHRVFELELMHRWTTSTYRSLCSVPEDVDCLQVQVPRWAFKHDYLLNGILALSALEAAACDADIGDTGLAYVSAAIDYYDKASASFRRQLSENRISAENTHFVYMFSCLVWPINLAMARAQPELSSALDRVKTLMELSSGSAFIAQSNWSSMINGPIAPSIRAVMASVSDTTVPDPLDVATKEALARFASAVESALSSADTDGTLSDTVSARESYTNAVVSIHACFVEEAKGSVRGFCMAFPSLYGQYFAIAINKSDAIALFILMHWAVLVDNLKEVCWWVQSVGKDLVKEISDIILLEQLEVGKMLEFRENVNWARKQVGLFETSKDEI